MVARCCANADQLAPRQRYYCFNDCGKKFQASWGQLVEVKRRNAKGEMEVYYMRADVPSWDVEDVRAMFLEDTMAKDCDRAVDRFNKVQTVRPTVSALVIRRSRTAV